MFPVVIAYPLRLVRQFYFHLWQILIIDEHSATFRCRVVHRGTIYQASRSLAGNNGMRIACHLRHPRTEALSIRLAVEEALELSTARRRTEDACAAYTFGFGRADGTV